jgi:hypothetical protein
MEKSVAARLRRESELAGDAVRGTEDEIMELGVHCAYAVGFERRAATCDVTDDVPEAFRSKSEMPVAPWVAEGVAASG